VKEALATVIQFKRPISNSYTHVPRFGIESMDVYEHEGKRIDVFIIKSMVDAVVSRLQE